MMDMILECKVSEDSYDENRMDILFGELEQRDPHHPAVLQYRSFKLGSAKTLSSIMVTAVSNLHMLQSAAFAEMIATDEMFLPKLGIAILGFVKADKTRKPCHLRNLDQGVVIILAVVYV